MDTQAVKEKIRQLEGLTDEERNGLLALLNHQKKYGLVWEEKREEVEERLRTQLPVLEEVKERALLSNDPAAPNHILIEGDNLEALVALTYTHEGKVDVIYIDPPYNTGNKDFSYNDSFVDAEDGYRHSKWLSFMSKRLKIAKQLLSDRGVIFISIDDNEQAQLKLLCDEVFGEKNFIGQLVLKTATDNNPSQINIEHEYMLCYCKFVSNQGNWKRQSKAAKMIISKYKEIKGLNISNEEIQRKLRDWIKTNKKELPQVAHYNNVDNKGVYSSSSNSSNPHPGGYDYDILHPITHKSCPKPSNGWRWPYVTFKSYDDLGEVEWGDDEKTQPHIKKRIESSMEYLRSLIYEDNRGTTKALSDIFLGKKVFNNPKPNTVLSRIFDFASSRNSIILDFFAGSGTTLHATMQLNKEDGGHRQCILVTNNENRICEEVTYVRNKRVIQGYVTPKGEFVEGLKANTLRYYRTKLLPRVDTNQNRRALMAACTELLCIEQDLYEEQTSFAGRKLNPRKARYFAQGKRRMLVIYDEQTVDTFAELLREMEVEERIRIYLFSFNGYPHTDNFMEVLDKVELCALPQAIYNVYNRVLPKAVEPVNEEEERP